MATMWFHVAVIIWAWAVVDGSLDSTEKVLLVVSSRLLNKVAGDCRWHCGVDFPDHPKGKYGLYSPWCCACVQCAEMLERTRTTHIGIRARTPWP